MSRTCSRILIFCCSLCLGLLAILPHMQAFTAKKTFQTLTDRLFQTEVTSSTLTLHYTLQNPKTYGISEIPVRFSVSDTSDISSEYLHQLKDVHYASLSRCDQLTYDILYLLLQQEETARTFHGYSEPLGATIGIQAQLPILLSEYRMESVEDIQTYLKLLSGIDTYFSSLLAYEREKAAAGLFMPSVNADGIISQCRAFTEVPLSQHLLVTVFNQKTNQAAFLSTAEKETFQEQNLKMVEQHVFPAYQLLIHGLSDLKKSCRNEMGLCYLPKGRAYYEYLVKSSTGSALSIDAIQNRIQTQLLTDADSCRQLLIRYPDLASISVSGLPEDPSAILSQLQQKMEADFPKAPDTDWELKYVDSSLSSYLSPAFYLTAPIDNINDNVIYLNPAAGCDALELYTTLAHEGYPGHLYQNLFSSSFLSPLRSLFSFGGYTEGWATYVEMLSYDYAAAGMSETDAAAISLAQKQRSMMLGLSSLLDILIHYRGFQREDTAQFLENLGITSSSAANSLYDAVLESPANYLKYDLGYLTFLDLRDSCMRQWPEQFSLSDFHRKILEIGPCPFPILEKYLNLWYTESL